MSIGSDRHLCSTSNCPRRGNLLLVRGVNRGVDQGDVATGSTGHTAHARAKTRAALPHARRPLRTLLSNLQADLAILTPRQEIMDQKAVLMLCIKNEFEECAKRQGPKKAYLTLSRKYHPDKSADTLQAFQCLEAVYAPYKEEERFQKQREADLLRLAELEKYMAVWEAEEEVERAKSRLWRQERAERKAKHEAKQQAKRAKRAREES